MKWNLEQGIKFCQIANNLLAIHNAHTALTGSVLFKGWSDKDLDVIVYPSKTADVFPDIVQLCKILNLDILQYCTALHEQYGDGKTVFMCRTAHGQRVDLFLMR